MSMIEQKFSILDSFTTKGYRIDLVMQTGWYRITIKKGNEVWSVDGHKDADGALTEALKWLRKDSKKTIQ